MGWREGAFALANFSLAREHLGRRAEGSMFSVLKHLVIPAKARTQHYEILLVVAHCLHADNLPAWVTAFAGMTRFLIFFMSSGCCPDKLSSNFVCPSFRNISPIIRVPNPKASCQKIDVYPTKIGAMPGSTNGDDY